MKRSHSFLLFAVGTILAVPASANSQQPDSRHDSKSVFNQDPLAPETLAVIGRSALAEFLTAQSSADPSIVIFQPEFLLVRDDQHSAVEMRIESGYGVVIEEEDVPVFFTFLESPDRITRDDSIMTLHMRIGGGNQAGSGRDPKCSLYPPRDGERVVFRLFTRDLSCRFVDYSYSSPEFHAWLSKRLVKVTIEES